MLKQQALSCRRATNGVSQRSIWGLILLNISTNDLCTKGRRLLIKPADDSKEEADAWQQWNIKQKGLGDLKDRSKRPGRKFNSTNVRSGTSEPMQEL